jgi:uncharacterized NAD(P)/FAD-binding protein YdhS
MNNERSVAIIGGGPSGLLMFKRLVGSDLKNFTIDIFEAKDNLGAGMPYSSEGSNKEHITNVSGNEIPDLITPLIKWIKTQPSADLKKYDLDKENFSAYKVVPRLLFGEYLGAQFRSLEEQAKNKGITTRIHLNNIVTDIANSIENNKVTITTDHGKIIEFDSAIICTGHAWPLTHEETIEGYFDSPYPPAKLKFHANHPIAIRGSSLTAIDAIRTIARNHGNFIEEGPHQISFQLNQSAKNFKIVMHSRLGLLPAIRFHLEDPKLSKDSLLTKEEIARHMNENDGFLSLDLIFEKDFKDLIAQKDPAFYARIKTLRLEEFVELIMKEREQTDPFVLFKMEYQEAARSIEKKRSIYWKELLATLSFAMNFPAKHFSAEDMQRLQRTLMPLIAVVIAFVPQSSCEELIALHDAGILELVAVGEDALVKAHPEGGITYHLTDEKNRAVNTRFRTFVDCIGQRHLSLEDLPFHGLVHNGMVSSARVKFRSADEARLQLEEGNDHIEMDGNNNYFLKVPGIAINDHFRIMSKDGKSDPRIHIMAVPFIGGFNPDYSGLDFCEEASKIIVHDLLEIAKDADQ